MNFKVVIVIGLSWELGGGGVSWQKESCGFK